jgi:hypothetical protein
MHHALLVAKQVVGKIGILLECLADTGDVAVSKNTYATAKECLLLPVASHKLGFEKLNGGLRHGQPARHIHPSLLIPTILLHNNRLANGDRPLETHQASA